MLELIKKHPRYAVGALLVHLFFLVLFGVGIHMHYEQRAASNQQQTLAVKMVNEKLVQKQLAAIKAHEEAVRRQKEERVREREAKARKLAEQRAKQLAEQKKEKERLAQEKRQALLRQKQMEAEQKRKALERKQRAEELAKVQAQSEQAFKQQLAREAKRMQVAQQIAAERRAALKAKQDKIDKYMDLIENKIYQNWVMPPSANKGMVCELLVQLIPTGEVVNIELAKSSGDPEFDQSVIAAVRRASPLPVPTGNLFDEFRNLHLPVRADKKT